MIGLVIEKESQKETGVVKKKGNQKGAGIYWIQCRHCKLRFCGLADPSSNLGFTTNSYMSVHIFTTCASVLYHSDIINKWK